ncbi:hypothetical protein V8B97DRAFT_1954520 [Scleroderma yunnanense]
MTVKVTYSAKGKKKRRAAEKDTTEHMSEEDSDARSQGSGKERGSASPDQVRKTSESIPGSKIVDVHLPGPSPKRPTSSGEGVEPPIPTSTSSPHQTSASPIRKRQESPSIRAKVPSPLTMKPSPMRGPSENPVEDADETESIPESSSGIRVRRTEVERIQYFKDQPECSELEVHRAFCTRCDSWVNLGKRQSYTVRPWEKHRTKCDLKPAVVKESKLVSEEAPQPGENVGAIPVTEEEELAPTSPAPSVAPSSPASSKSIRKSEAERLATLQADPRVQEIKPHEVLCRSCQKWIKLSGTQAYALSDWQSHSQHCSGSSPSSRVATAERKIALLNDPQVRTASPKSVQCTYCKVTVALEGDVEYDLAKWNEHKITCIPMTPAASQTASKVLSSRLSHVFPSTTPRNIATPTPTSRTLRGLALSGGALASATLAVDSSTAQVGTKRARDDDPGAPEEDRPSNRPRSEEYQPPETEPPSPWGWFMQPLKAFVRGFREGLGAPT